MLRLERRVNVYDREVHDFVFMRDPAIVKCLEGAPAAPPPAASTAAVPAPDADDDAVPDGAVPPSLPGVLPSLTGAPAADTPDGPRPSTDR